MINNKPWPVYEQQGPRFVIVTTAWIIEPRERFYFILLTMVKGKHEKKCKAWLFHPMKNELNVMNKIPYHKASSRLADEEFPLESLLKFKKKENCEHMQPKQKLNLLNRARNGVKQKELQFQHPLQSILNNRDYLCGPVVSIVWNCRETQDY